MANPNLPPAGKPAEQWTKAEQDAFWHEQNERAKRVSDIVAKGLTPWADVREFMTNRQWYRIESFVRAAVEMADYFGNKGVTIEVKLERRRDARKYSPNSTWQVEVKVEQPGPNSVLHYATGWAFIGKHGAVNGRIWDLFSERCFGDMKPLTKRSRAKKA